jgi:hypothetical protein
VEEGRSGVTRKPSAAKKATTTKKPDGSKTTKGPGVTANSEGSETETASSPAAAKDMKKDEFYEGEAGKSSDSQFEKMVKKNLQKIEKMLEKISGNIMGLKSVITKIIT